MSRSRKKTNIGGITTAASEKEDKRIWHKKYRRKTKAAIKKEKEMPSHREVSNPWSMSKDGKRMFKDDKYRRK